MFLVLYLQLVKHKKNKNFVKRKFNFQVRTGTVAVLLDWRKTKNTCRPTLLQISRVSKESDLTMILR